MQVDKDANKKHGTDKDENENQPFVTPMVDKDAAKAESVPIPGSFDNNDENGAE